MKPITVDELIESLKAFPGHCKVYAKPSHDDPVVDPEPVTEVVRHNTSFGMAVLILTD